MNWFRQLWHRHVGFAKGTAKSGDTNPTLVDEKLAEVASNLPGKRDYAEHNDLNTFDVDGLLTALDSSNRKRRLIAIEKLAWSLYGENSSLVEQALELAMHDQDKYIAIRSANTFLMEGQPGYRERVVAASEDLSIDEDIRLSFKAMIAMTDEMRKRNRT